MPRHKGQNLPVDHDSDTFRQRILVAKEQIHTARKAARSWDGLSQNLLAREAGINEGWFSRFIRGERAMRKAEDRRRVISTLDRLGARAGISIDVPGLAQAGNVTAPERAVAFPVSRRQLLSGVIGTAATFAIRDNISAPMVQTDPALALAKAREAERLIGCHQYDQVLTLTNEALDLLNTADLPPEKVTKTARTNLVARFRGNSIALEAYVLTAQVRGRRWHGIGGAEDFGRAAHVAAVTIAVIRELVAPGARNGLLADAYHWYGKALLESAATDQANEWEWRSLRQGHCARIDKALDAFKMERALRPLEDAAHFSDSWRNASRACRVGGSAYFSQAKIADFQAAGFLGEVSRWRPQDARARFLNDQGRQGIVDGIERRRVEKKLADSIAIGFETRGVGHIPLALVALAELHASSLNADRVVKDAALDALVAWPSEHETRDSQKAVSLLLELDVSDQDVVRYMETKSLVYDGLSTLPGFDPQFRLQQSLKRLQRARRMV